MRDIQISYTVLDIIQVPDNATDEEIWEICNRNWQYKLDDRIEWNDMEWN